MSTYEYVDFEGMSLRVATVDRLSMTYVGIEPMRRVAGDIYSGPPVHVEPEDAPVVALAILEAAGLAEGMGEYDPGEVRAPVHVAIEKLRRIRDDRAQRVKQEALDAEVTEYIVHRAKSIGLKNPTPWSEMTETHRNAWRDEYRAAREFFTRDQGSPQRRPEEIQPGESLQSWAKRLQERTDERERRIAEALQEKPAARVLQYGDPEPDHNTQWRDQYGTRWHWDPADGWAGEPEGQNHTYPIAAWSVITKSAFPMTEVTDRD